MADTDPLHPGDELSIDELSVQAGLPSRTIREYQTLGVLSPPERRGRIGIYRSSHLRRLELIGRLQERGYSLAGIRDLLTSWSDGNELSDVLGLDPDELVHLDEPGAPASIEQLTRLLPTMLPERLDDLLAVGIVDACGPDRYCVPSPSLLQLSADVLDAGYSPDDLLVLLRSIHDAATLVADTTQRLLATPPAGLSAKALDRLATRGRGLLAHGTGRLTVYTLGQRLDPAGPGRRGRRRG